MIDLYDLIKEVNRYSGTLGIAYFLLFLTKNKNKNTKIAFFILLASFLADFTNYFFIRYIYKNGYIIINTWVIVNYILVCWLFVRLIPDKKKAINFLLLIFFTGSVISFSFYYSFLESNTFIKSFSSVSFTVLCIITFYEILKESPTNRLSEYPVFWIISALFFYSSITLLKNLFEHYLVFDLEIDMSLFKYVTIFNLTFNIIKNIMFFFAFTLVSRGYPDYIYPKTK